MCIEEIGISMDESVCRNDDGAGNFEIFEPIFGALGAIVAVVDDDVNRWRKASKFALPVPDDAHRANEQYAATIRGRSLFHV